MTNRKPLDFTAIRRAVRPEQVLRLVGWRPIGYSRRYLRGPCPVHRSTWPRSRALVVGDEVVYCHKCRWTGDAIALYARLAGCSKLDAAYACCYLVGLDPPVLNFRS